MAAAAAAVAVVMMVVVEEEEPMVARWSAPFMASRWQAASRLNGVRGRRLAQERVDGASSTYHLPSQ